MQDDQYAIGTRIGTKVLIMIVLYFLIFTLNG